MIDIEHVSDRILMKEWNDCQNLWSTYSCDCFGFYIKALSDEILKRKLNPNL